MRLDTLLCRLLSQPTQPSEAEVLTGGWRHARSASQLTPVC